MKKIYISPDVDVLLFLPQEQLAAETDPTMIKENDSNGEAVPDVTIHGPQIPGWGN